MKQGDFEKQGHTARAALKRDDPVKFETVVIHGLEYYVEPGETQREATKRIRTESGKLTPRGELTVMRDRAKRPFWVQHERMNVRTRVSKPIASEHKARKLFADARAVKGTTTVMLFQHGIDKTIIIDQFKDYDLLGAGRKRPAPDAPIRDELR